MTECVNLYFRVVVWLMLPKFFIDSTSLFEKVTDVMRQVKTAGCSWREFAGRWHDQHSYPIIIFARRTPYSYF